MHNCKITFQPSGRSVYALPGTTVFEAAGRAGLLLQSPCGGRGTCGKCRVRVISGDIPPSPACREFFNKEDIAAGFRLACQVKIDCGCVIEVPDSSLFANRNRILKAGKETEGGVQVQPAIWKRYLQMPEPTAEDPVSDLARIEREVGRLRAHLDVLRTLPDTLRACNFRGTVAACEADRELLAFEPGETTDHCYGVAVDLGSTTVVASLMDLNAGREVGVAAEMNPQISFGDDVISRISRAREQPEALDRLRQAAVEIVNRLIATLCAEGNVDPRHVYEVALAGNTTMQHLFCGINPAALGEVPFPATYHHALSLKTAEAGLTVSPASCLYVFPNIGGFVGGDTVAGILATGLHHRDGVRLLIDIGTNGEIVLAHDGRLLCTSTAAGPAFEGARIAAGMRATEGAIEQVVMRDDDIACNVIGGGAPAGICGTALIDLAAQLLRLGAIDETGRILPPDEIPGTISEFIRNRLIPNDKGQVDFCIAEAGESATGSPLLLLQRDIRELQLASAAIRAGVNIMLRQAGLHVDDVEEVLLAGGFGNFIRRTNALRIGLLPAIPHDRIRFVGNAAGMGARIALLATNCRQQADDIATKAEHIDLSLDPEFQMEFGTAMLFPTE